MLGNRFLHMTMDYIRSKFAEGEPIWRGRVTYSELTQILFHFTFFYSSFDNLNTKYKIISSLTPQSNMTYDNSQAVKCMEPSTSFPS